MFTFRRFVKIIILKTSFSLLQFTLDTDSYASFGRNSNCFYPKWRKTSYKHIRIIIYSQRSFLWSEKIVFKNVVFFYVYHPSLRVYFISVRIFLATGHQDQCNMWRKQDNNTTWRVISWNADLPICSRMLFHWAIPPCIQQGNEVSILSKRELATSKTCRPRAIWYLRLPRSFQK